ncbi:major facilitator superfamily domain-containing protein [Cantharellus anzutake]|uniref:major facilitator superfamily domain-containing protein n=1 Tax=Cantharellus anzutake TaxID=1750568 RepID=UPI001905C276|nr:major facilitator superfamily domain-containing protein [Cantharellus anzutake]KAF8342798.1 major facilitator superfamily domain-containing protein [Cantharellus anzutake]
MLPIGSFFFGKLEDQYGYRRFIILGSVLHVLSVFLSAWSTKIWHFFITQGLMLGMSNGILFPILCALPAQWFRRRKAFATGIVIAGSSFGGGMNALIIRALLSHMSLRGVYLVQSGVEVVILGISFVLMKEREYPQRAEAEAPFNVEKQQISPDAKIEGSEDVESPSVERVQPEVLPRTKWLNSSLFRDSVFWSLEISLTIAVFGHLVPFLFLPLFIRSKLPGISSSLCTLPITIANISAFIGRIIVGLTADNFGPANTLFISLFISGITQVIIWNLIGNFGANESSTYGMIMFFAILYGFWGGCFVSLLTPVGAQLFGSDQPANLSGLLVISGFPGYFAGPTLAGTILSCSNQNWHIVSLYAGGVQICGAVIFLWARFKRMPRIFVRF